MTRKDYVLLSTALAAGLPSSDSSTMAFIRGYCQAVHVLAQALQAANPRFESERFLVDAGYFLRSSSSSGQ